MQTILGSGGAIGVQLAKELTKYTNEIRLVSRNPLAVQFYELIRTLDTCKSSIAHNTTLIVSTDSDLFRLLQNTTH